MPPVASSYSCSPERSENNDSNNIHFEKQNKTGAQAIVKQTRLSRLPNPGRSLRPRSHRSIRYTVFAIRFALHHRKDSATSTLHHLNVACGREQII